MGRVEKGAPRLRYVRVNHWSSTSFQGASEALRYARSHLMRMAAVWAVQSVRPRPRRPGSEGLWVRGFARSC
jgi:hypothetical protein